MDLSDDDAYQAYINYLVEEGGLILESITPDGEPVYRHDLDVLQRIAPEYAAAFLRTVEDTLISLYEKGLVSLEITDEGETLYKVADGIDIDEYLSGA